MEEEGVPSTALREVSLLQMLSESRHVVQLLKVEHVEEGGKPVLYLVFEYLTTDLKKWMDKRGKGPQFPLSRTAVKQIMWQLCRGVAHCHRYGVLHRDLKPQNLLVDDGPDGMPVVRVADLGLGRAFSVPLKAYTHEIVTLWYRAPEVLLGGTHYGCAVDVWSIGCIFAELVRKAPLFPGDSEFQQLLHIFKLLGTPQDDGPNAWPGAKQLRDWHEYPRWPAADLVKYFPGLEPAGLDLLRRCFVYDPAGRISAEDCLRHPYFDDLDKAAMDRLENPALVMGPHP